jgi:conjugal transfer pilus assembly protein TraF
MMRFLTIIAATVAAVLTLGSAAQASGPKASSGASAAYCSRDLGTWFYCSRLLPEEPAAQQAEPSAQSKAAEDEEIAKFEEFKAELERASKLAVWNPTPENVERFYRLQRLALNQSSLFSDQYRRLVWTNPDLDYSLKRPVNELGKREWADTRLADRQLFLRKIAGGVGVFYVFRGNCSPCKVFSPIVRDFSRRYALTVKGVSVDGSENAYLDNYFVDRGQLRSWGIDNPTTPSILLYQSSSVDPKTGDVRPTRVRLSDDRLVEVAPCLKPRGCVTYIGAGVMAQDDIVERIYVMLATRPGEDY